MKLQLYKRLLVHAFVALILSVASVHSWAQSSTATPVSNAAGPAIAALGTIIAGIESKLEAMVNSSGAAALGLQILGFFVLLNVVWALIKGMATGRMIDYMIGELLPIGIVAVIAWMFLGQVGGVQGLGDSTRQFMNAVGKAVGGSAYQDGSIATLIQVSVNSALEVIAQLFDLRLSSSTTGFWNFDSAGVVLTLISALLKMITIVIVFLILVCTLGVFIATVVMTQMSMYIALLLMPLFIPFMVFKPLESFFDKWLTFFVSSLMAKVIGCLIINITNEVMKNMVTVSRSLPPQKDGADGLMVDVILYVVMILMALICYMMVTRIDGIARGLTGNVSLGFQGFGKELRGAMGGIGTAQRGGTALGGKSPINATSTLTAMVPNIAKPVSNAAGNMASSVRGKVAFRNDMKKQAELDQFQGAHKPGQGQVTRDLTKMSQQAANSYRAAHERATAKQATNWNGNFQGGMPTMKSK